VLVLKLRSPALFLTIGVTLTGIVAILVVNTLLQTGGVKALSDNAALIGAVVALGGVFTAQMVSIALDDQRAREARLTEALRGREATLQKYLEQVGKLLIEKPLHRASPGDSLSTVVRAQTLAALEGLDPTRKRILLQFLYDSGLIRRNKPVVDLRLADLSGADLRSAYLHLAYLREVDLDKADLRGALLVGADLRSAQLVGADLRGAFMRAVDLHGANLSEANLSEADTITNKQVEQQAEFLRGTIMPDGTRHL
jgi:hypothetical protein